MIKKLLESGISVAKDNDKVIKFFNINIIYIIPYFIIINILKLINNNNIYI